MGDFTWWSHPDLPPSMLSQCCWAQGSTPMTIPAKSTDLSSNLNSQQPCANHASLDKYLHLPEPVMSSVKWADFTYLIVNQIMHETKTVFNSGSYNNVAVNFRVSSCLYCDLTVSSTSFYLPNVIPRLRCSPAALSPTYWAMNY